MNTTDKTSPIFPFHFQINGKMWKQLNLDELKHFLDGTRPLPPVMAARHIADRLNRQPGRTAQPASPGILNIYGLMLRIFRYMIRDYTVRQNPAIIPRQAEQAGFPLDRSDAFTTLVAFTDLFPPLPVLNGAEIPVDYINSGTGQERKEEAVRELLILRAAMENKALISFKDIFDDQELAATSPYVRVMTALEASLAAGPPDKRTKLTLPDLLRAPSRACPDSLQGQMEFIRDTWRDILPSDLLDELLTAIEILSEEWRQFHGGPGSSRVLRFGKGGAHGYDPGYPEYERFSPDADWMPNVVMIAKMVYVWLDQLSKKYARPITRLDQIPDDELDRLATWGFSALWLIGLWERSAASAKIKQICGNPEAISSAYSLYDYVIAHDLGGPEALDELKQRCRKRGIRLASDMVPNHTGLHSKWTVEHPDWFVQLDYPPYPGYSFNGPDLSFSPEVSLHIEDGYWDKRDAAVVFKHYDHRDGRTRYIYHGNDGTSFPWNDTAQLNYLLPQVREAVIQTILHVARQFPIIRFDAAMTLAKKHYQRLWFPQPGHAGVPSRAEHGMSRAEFDAAFPEEFWREVVDRMAVEAPDTLLLAEAFWLMEGYFVRTLGMHRVYNSAFMNMLKMEENAKYRQTIKNVLEFNPEILKRFVNFMNNPDEKTAVEQFGKENKYIGAAVLLVTMPGLPMFGHGQVEGFHEKYGMEYKKAYWDEPVDEHLLWLHETKIFPLARRRWLFSGAEHFFLFDFWQDGHVDENVFAYSNRAGSERALIVYHNKFGDTRGWVKDSAAVAVKEGDGTTLIRKSLGEALGFNPDNRCYYAFRDYATGLEYIRAGSDLCSRGLFLELDAYKYYAFMDFREIWEDDFGNWGKLCYQLGGNPVDSIDQELRQVRFAASIEQFAEVLASCCDLCEELSGNVRPLGGLTVLQQLYQRFITTITEESSERITEDGGWANFTGMLTILDSISTVTPSKKSRPWHGIMPEAPFSPREQLLLVCIALLSSLKAGTPEELPSFMAANLEEFGLDRPLTEAFRSQAGTGKFEDILEPVLVTLLLQALLSIQEFPVDKDSWEGLFASPWCADFINLHESDGLQWFNKERFEMLLGWLGLIAAWKSGEMEAVEQNGLQVVMLAVMAEKTGYRLDRFLELVSGTAKDVN